MKSSKNSADSEPPKAPSTSAGGRLHRGIRISRENDFRRIFAEGRSSADASLVVYALANDLGVSRLGVVAPRRLGKAVDRNRAKRRLREAFRATRAQGALPVGLDLIVIARKSACNVGFTSLKCSLVKLAREAAGKCAKQ
jgi:ribonuclease P protein component